MYSSFHFEAQREYKRSKICCPGIYYVIRAETYTYMSQLGKNSKAIWKFKRVYIMIK